MRVAVGLLAAAGILSGCTTYADGFAYQGPVVPIAAGDRDGFCQSYGDRTARNAFYNYADDDGASLIAYRQADRIGQRAYERCVRGQTG